MLAEAARLARTVAVIEHCGTRGESVTAGGSRFPTPDQLIEVVGRSGFDRCECVELTVAAPPRWCGLQKAFDAGSTDRDTRRDEGEIDDLIADGTLVPIAVVAHRA